MKLLLASVRILALAFLVCCVAYPLVILGFGRTFAPDSVEGSLVRANDGTVLGSRLIGQGFSSPRYFWPRPSAVDYNAAAAGGSNLSPAGEKVRTRGVESVALFEATASRPLPSDLATASGSGLDPDITLAAVLFQIPRVAAARGIPEDELRALATRLAETSALAPEPRVNVLRLNVSLDALRLTP